MLPASDTTAEYERAARAQIAYSDALARCPHTAGGPRKKQSGDAFGYAMAADFYRCAHEKSLAARYEQKAKSLIAGLGLPGSSEERKDFETTIKEASPRPGGGCWASDLFPRR